MTYYHHAANGPYAAAVLANQPPGGGWFRVVSSEAPAYDPATESVVPGAYVFDTEAQTFSRPWTVVALPQPAIDAASSSAEFRIFSEQLAAGFEDAATGIKLKTTERAQTKFTSQVTLIQVALAAGVITTASTQTFFDFEDAAQQLTTADFLGLMLRYGAHCQSLFINYAP